MSNEKLKKILLILGIIFVAYILIGSIITTIMTLIFWNNLHSQLPF